MRADGVPLVRFLDGRELRVPADQLTNVPAEAFESEIANRSRINAYLILRVHGRGALGPSGRLWTRDHEGLWATMDSLPPEPVPPPGTMPYFVPDDIGEDARVVDPSELSEEHDVVECTVTRVSGNGANGESGRA